ncbi:hypothetical protein VP1G_03396 [Cytospora mali]|uniref:Biogenesis of lysosome-related organelles complex 1 subunit CNL1 n=1 Tax=Cytospora mali TaxID=578113 RepID=A0A194UWG0_CYTMA|nr:hypothetical protein VP1G_03396 [Valsa mali var. pyri (nom. inval.)]
MSSSSQAPQAVSVSQLGLSSDEVAVLQHAQREAAAGGSNSSRAASRASSQGLLLLDSGSLAQLGRHFDRLMQQISQQLDHLTEQTQIVTMTMYDAAGNLVDNADAEIRRYHSIMAQMDDLEVEFDRIRHIRDIVREYRQRVQELERALDSTGIHPRTDIRPRMDIIMGIGGRDTEAWENEKTGTRAKEKKRKEKKKGT